MCWNFVEFENVLKLFQANSFSFKAFARSFGTYNGILDEYAASHFPLLFAITAISVLSHELTQKLVGRKLRVKTTLKAEYLLILPNLLLGLVGGFFPAFGSTYIRQIDWYYNPKQDKIGSMLMVGPLVSIVFAFVFGLCQLLEPKSYWSRWQE